MNWQRVMMIGEGVGVTNQHPHPSDNVRIMSDNPWQPFRWEHPTLHAQQCFVKLCTGRTIIMKYWQWELVESFECRLACRIGFPQANFWLAYGGKALQGGNTMEYYDVQQDGTLYQNSRMLGGSGTTTVYNVNSGQKSLPRNTMSAPPLLGRKWLNRTSRAASQLRPGVNNVDSRDSSGTVDSVGVGRVEFNLPVPVVNWRPDVPSPPEEDILKRIRDFNSHNQAAPRHGGPPEGWLAFEAGGNNRHGATHPIYGRFKPAPINFGLNNVTPDWVKRWEELRLGGIPKIDFAKDNRLVKNGILVNAFEPVPSADVPKPTNQDVVCTADVKETKLSKLRVAVHKFSVEMFSTGVFTPTIFDMLGWTAWRDQRQGTVMKAIALSQIGGCDTMGEEPVVVKPVVTFWEWVRQLVDKRLGQRKHNVRHRTMNRWSKRAPVVKTLVEQVKFKAAGTFTQSDADKRCLSLVVRQVLEDVMKMGGVDVWVCVDGDMVSKKVLISDCEASWYRRAVEATYYVEDIDDVFFRSLIPPSKPVVA
jgi:hypothetical protein